MGIESGPKFNSQESEKPHPKTPEEVAERKEHEIKIFGAVVKAAAALDVGILSTLKEAWFTSEEEWEQREKDTGTRGGWALRNFAEKSLRGYQAMEKIDEVLEEERFQDISLEYEKRMAEAANAEERDSIEKEFEEIKRSRDEKIAQEVRSKNVRNTILGIFNETLKK